jgi:hypothetical protein
MTPRAFEKKYLRRSVGSGVGRSVGDRITLSLPKWFCRIVLRWRLGDDVEVICVWPDGISVVVVVVVVVVRGDAMAATDCDPLIVFRVLREAE